MTRDQLRLSNGRAGRSFWGWTGKIALTWAAIFFLISLVWVDLNALTRKPPRAGKFLFLAALLFLLALAFERGLAHLGFRRKWRYRLAFLISAAIPLLYWVILGLGGSNLALNRGYSVFSLGLVILELVIALIGAGLGSIVATGVHMGWWENNSPPSDKIQQEVHQRHLTVIGMPGPGLFFKRCFDHGLALIGLLVSAPLWILCTFMIWFEDPGPVLFVKNSVGKGGVNFHQFKFRTMVYGAEENTGPVLSQLGDERVLGFGRFLRKTALDELPQVINILRGEMSFVGPRPQRTVLVCDYLNEMPEYAQRHRVLPGLAGLAQVAGDYYLTPRQKLRYDRLYIRYMGLGFDIKLLFLAFMIAFWYRWQGDWNGILPRKALRFGSPDKTEERKAVRSTTGSLNLLANLDQRVEDSDATE